MFGLARGLAVVLAMVLLQPWAAAAGERYGLGRRATTEEIAGWDIDVRPDGTGLPAGQGSVQDGEEVYLEQCASCHGEFGEAFGRFPPLMGGFDTLTMDRPVKTIGSYWPYATTVFDYVYRAMPFGYAQSLTADQTYAVVAYLLYLNEVVDDESFVLSDQNLASIEMPNRDGFIERHGPDLPPREACMSACKDTVKIIGRAAIIDVTPEDEQPAIE
jgi:mono/diheme cytochrome c family protein